MGSYPSVAALSAHVRRVDQARLIKSFTPLRFVNFQFGITVNTILGRAAFYGYDAVQHSVAFRGCGEGVAVSGQCKWIPV